MEMAIKSSYEESRLKRLEENKRRMEELKLNKLSEFLHKPIMKKFIPKVPKQYPSPCRRSCRCAEKPAMNYKESMHASQQAPMGIKITNGGRIFGTLPKIQFGPISAENDPQRKQGVLVGVRWLMRSGLRLCGVHYPSAAVGGKAHIGAQSVLISGSYEDDDDNGDWFIYTGSGGTDLSDSKSSNEEQLFDQEFEEENEALRFSCINGYPVRVVRRKKGDKRSPYGPSHGYRYDGVYRIEKCWRKSGKQNFKVCRYLFVRCDNEPAPWTSDEHGDRPRQLPTIPELEHSTDISERTEAPSWDYDDVEGCWKWKKLPPVSQDRVVNVNSEEMEPNTTSMEKRLLEEFSCLLCEEVMSLPMTTPCGHNYCKECLENAFAGWKFERERVSLNGRKLRTLKYEMKCPSCPINISEFLQNPQVNMEMKDEIEKMQSMVED